MKDKLIQYFNDKQAELPVFQGLNRKHAIKLFEQTGFPNARLENWQKSVIRKFVEKTDYSVNNGVNRQETEFQLTENDHTIFIRLNRSVQSTKPIWQNASGAVMGTLRFGAENFPAIFNHHFNAYAKPDLNGLTAISTALTDNGYFLYFPKGSAQDKTLHLIIDGNQDGEFVLSRNLIILEDNVSATFIQSDLTNDQHNGFKNALTEVYLGKGAQFSWFKEQDLGMETGSVDNVFIHHERDSESTILNAGIKGAMLRNEVHVRLNDEGCSSNVFGVYLPGTGEQVDNQVFIDHAFPNCQSNELFKGVLNGTGTSVFNGHILVRQDAQKTNAYQKNRNILLSDTANAYAKPFLEIYADDVKCSHGATIGQLDENALFYLQSRGLSVAKAKEFLVKAFLGEILDICSHEGFRQNLEEKIQLKLHK